MNNLKLEYIVKAVVGILILGGSFYLKNAGKLSDAVFQGIVVFLYPSIVGVAEYFKTMNAKK